LFNQQKNEGIMDFLNNRRSIRRYKTDDISDELLNSLLLQAERTQTMGNMQLYSVVVTRSKEMKEALAPVHFNQPMVTGAPVVLTFCADFNRTVKWCSFRDANSGYDNLLSLMNAVSDTLLYTQTFSCLAEEAGLGLCYLGTTLYNAGQIIDLLKLPQLVLPVATLTVGYPDECPPMTDRLPLEALIHQEHYHDYDEQTINEFYQTKESLPENQEFVKVNQKQTLAQVFAEVRYNKADNEAISGVLLETLKKQGFLK
jgi:FMN reductase (NADPH)